MYEWVAELKSKYEARNYIFFEPENYKEHTASNKKILLLSHQMSLTGAPQALFTMANILSKSCEVMVATVEDGPLVQKYIEYGIPIVWVGRYWERQVVFKAFCREFNGIVANTVLNFPCVMILSGTTVPVFWWIHEHENYFEYGRGEIPNPYDLKENIHMYAVGEYVRNVIQREFSYDCQLLRYGIEDLCKQTGDVEIRQNDLDTLHFAVVGSYGFEKGQDIVLDAYQMLPAQYQNHIEITFVGDEKIKDETIYSRVCHLEQTVSKIHKMEPVTREEILRKYNEWDGIILSSRKEVLSMAVNENMMLKKIVIVSSGSGNWSYIKDGVNGYRFDVGSAKGLAQCMQRAWDDRSKMSIIGAEARKTYLRYFSLEQFEESIRNEMLTNIN